MNLRKSLLFLWAVLCLAGCSTTITNITPSHVPRSANNLYPFEVELQTAQATIRASSMKAFVVVGETLYPMQPVQMLKNRWESVIPIPASTNYIYYRYKFDYSYDRIPKPAESSRLSPTYQLEIVDK